MPRLIYQILGTGEVVVVPPSATVQAAAVAMTERKTSAALVMTGDRLEGIVTEQDVVRRLVAKGLDGSSVAVTEIMTPDPDTISPANLADEGLKMMEEGCYRHLPVVQQGCVVGLVSRYEVWNESRRGPGNAPSPGSPM